METKKKKAVKKGTVVPKVKESEVKTCCTPPLQKVATEIKADEPQFVPESNEQNTAVILKSKNPATLPHRSTTTVDCGFSMKLQPGWKTVVSALPYWANKGLIVTNSGVYINEGRVLIYVTNVGKEIISIRAGDEIAQMIIEPSYLFDWIVSND